MTLSRKQIVLAAIVCGLVAATTGPAQETNLGDLGIRVNQQHLDSYWLDQSTWTQYGYRPYVKTHTHSFTNLPTYFGGSDYYSYGETMPSPDLAVKESQGDNVQLSKYGTWH